MLKHSNIFLLSVLALTQWSMAAQAGVRIAPETRVELLSGSIEIKAGKSTPIPISLSRGDELEVQIKVFGEGDNTISTFICDEQQVRTFRGGQNATCPGFYKEATPTKLSFSAPHTGNFFLMLDHSHGFLDTKKAFVQVSQNSTLGPKSVEWLHKEFSRLHRSVMETFQVQDFDITVRPCGMKNASSAWDGGHITMCSELIHDIYNREIYDAVEGVFYHELGHTLLNLWGMPNRGNEEVVDEFALVMMFWNGEQQKAIDWMKWHAESDPVAEAKQMMSKGMRHPLSVQRVRNAMRILRNPEDVIHRWNRFLYPQLTNTALKAIINDPPTYGDRELAQSLLRAQ